MNIQLPQLQDILKDFKLPQLEMPLNGNGLSWHRTPVKCTLLQGKWKRVNSLSQMGQMEKALDLMNLKGLQKRAALNWIDGLKLTLDEDETVCVEYTTKMPLPVRLSESYKHGKPTQHPRRDMRSGTQTAYLSKLDNSEMQVNISWEGEQPGRCVEVFRIDKGGKMLEVAARMEVGGESIDIKQVYSRYE